MAVGVCILKRAVCMRGCSQQRTRSRDHMLEEMTLRGARWRAYHLHEMWKIGGRHSRSRGTIKNDRNLHVRGST